MFSGNSTGAIKANEPNILREFDGSLELTKDWNWNVLKNMDWVKIKGTTGKAEPCVKVLEEETFLFQRVIFTFVLEPHILLDFEFNLN